jgi:hypothetical protein
MKYLNAKVSLVLANAYSTYPLKAIKSNETGALRNFSCYLYCTNRRDIQGPLQEESVQISKEGGGDQQKYVSLTGADFLSEIFR